MRKKLFLLSAMLIAGLTVSAQTMRETKPLINSISSEMTSIKALKAQNLTPTFAKRRAISAKDVNTMAKVKAQAPVSANSYLAYYYSGAFFSFNDMCSYPTITINGSTATITNIAGIGSEKTITGTVDNGTITITPQVLLEDALQTSDNTLYDLCIGLYNPNNRTIDNLVLTKNEYDIYESDMTAGIVVLYAGTPNTLSGIYDGFLLLEITPTTSLIPYYTTNDLWYYGYNIDGEKYITPTAIASKNGATIDFTSYITTFDNYIPVWSTLDGDVIGEGSPLQMPVTSDEMSFPVCYSFYNGEPVPSPFCYDQSTVIKENGTSIITTGNENIDYGLTTAYTTGRALSSAEEFAYGTGQFRTQISTETVASVMAYYPNKGEDFSFSSLDILLGYVSTETGNLTVGIYAINGLENGFPVMDASAELVALAQASIGSADNWGTLASTANGFEKNYNYGLLKFDNFTNKEGEPLSSIALNKPFVVMVDGFDETEAGITPETSSDFSKLVVGESENVFIGTTTNLIYRPGIYANAALYFRGAVVGDNENSISSITTENGTIKAHVNGVNFSVSYPEGMTSVEVLNVAGQKIASYNLEGTSTTIPAAGLTNGLYLLKFNNGATVKVMK